MSCSPTARQCQIRCVDLAFARCRWALFLKMVKIWFFLLFGPPLSKNCSPAPADVYHNINSLKGYSYFGNGFSRKLKDYQVDYSILTSNIGAPFTGNLCSILLVYIFIYNIDTYIKSYLYFMNEGLIPSGWTSYMVWHSRAVTEQLTYSARMPD